ncbi:uncharacterized protein LOC123691967 [Colias croceus]|uniref:uncharacterized protein LOC123691967 n=1 Tax=Colias crocea TaxID=72248 RepID=UPI001E27A404|nr:uncharacterized protein LOC123691967 [Colias croceus]XP_045492521.1 uncharacterized protein LOC123691967 [Colias croceus]
MEIWVWMVLMFYGSKAAVLPPPWADVQRNPCATHPRGWLMLYWPNDGKCYTIYKKGHPCPDTQELSPGRRGSMTVAECKCPPGTAQLPHTTTCHKLFERGPCRKGEYFAPVEESFKKRGERQGICVRPKQCADETLLYWPSDDRCYYRMSQGPCFPGAILDVGKDGLANCTCEKNGPNYWPVDGNCYSHYTRGPCERGQLFLPGAKCGCEPHLPHYHNETEGCYELDTSGPCPKGHTFSLAQSGASRRAQCTCRAFHARAADGACYRLYTRGPCAHDEMLARDGRCTKVPCGRGRLYYPTRRRCYRPGAAEPCPVGEVLSFDFEARPAVDGISHNGVCACGPGGLCVRKKVITCLSRPGAVIFANTCHILHTQGPCPTGSWLVRDTLGKAKCQCRPDTKCDS